MTWIGLLEWAWRKQHKFILSTRNTMYGFHLLAEKMSGAKIYQDNPNVLIDCDAWCLVSIRACCLEMVSGGFGMPSEPSLKLSLRSNLWNPFKTLHFLKGPLGVLEDIEVLDQAKNDVKGLGSFTKNFVKIGQQDPC